MSNENDLNEEVLNRMYLRVLMEESKNLRTGKLDDPKMVKQIERIIQMEMKGDKQYEISEDKNV